MQWLNDPPKMVHYSTQNRKKQGGNTYYCRGDGIDKKPKKERR